MTPRPIQNDACNRYMGMRIFARLLLFVIALGILVPAAQAWPHRSKKPDYRYKTPNLKYKKPKIQGHSAHRVKQHRAAH